MKNKKLIIFYITSIILILISLLYVSYGYVLTNIQGNEAEKSVSLNLRTIKIEFSDGSESLTSNYEGYFNPGSTLTKTFTIKNVGDTLYYNIKIDDLVNNFTRTSDITYELYLDDRLIASDIFPTVNDNYLLYNMKIGENVTQNYKLIIIYNESDENQIDDIGKTISGSLAFEETINSSTILNVYGNTITTLTDSEVGINPSTPATFTSLGSLVDDSSNENFGKYKIDLTASGKNLIPYPYYTANSGGSNGISWQVNEDRSITFNGTATSNVTMFLVSTTNPISLGEGTYTIGGNSFQNSGFRLWFREVNSSTNYISAYNGNSSQLTLTEEANMYVYVTINTGVTLENETIYPQLEKGTIATDYEPYIEPITQSIYLNEPLRCIDEGKVGCDYIDLVNKQVVRNVTELSFDGTEAWAATSNIGEYKLPFNLTANKESAGLCTHYKSLEYTSFQNKSDVGVYMRYSATLYILDPDIMDSLDTLTQTLSDWKSAGTPLTVYYQRPQPLYDGLIVDNLSYMENRTFTATDGTLSASKIEKS